MTQQVSRRTVAQGLAWTLPTVAVVSAAPFAAASEPGGPVDPGPGPGPGPGTELCGCTVQWKAGAILDVNMADYSNEGYTSYKNDDCGYLKTHHFTNSARTELRWRVPFGTVHALEAGTTITLAPVSGNWTFDTASFVDQTGTGAFARFTTITEHYAQAPSTPITPSFQGGNLVVTLPAMPADSHVIFTVVGRPVGGTTVTGDAFEIRATASGSYTEQAMEVLGCP